jgi:hypothetical protein
MRTLQVTYAGMRAKYLWHLMINSISLILLNGLVGMLGVGMDVSATHARENVNLKAYKNHCT